MHYKKILFYISLLLIAVILTGILFKRIIYTINQIEKRECEKWARWKKEYKNFYYTKWQKEQCGIKE